MLNLSRGDIVDIDYGSFSKVATYKGFEDGVHYFFDIDDTFGFSERFLSGGKVKIKKFEDE